MKYALATALLAILIAPQFTTAIELDEEPMDGQEQIEININSIQLVEDYMLDTDPTLPEITVSPRTASVRSTLQVFRNGQFTGSGTYSMIEGVPYLITASHVIDMTPQVIIVLGPMGMEAVNVFPEYSVCNRPILGSTVEICTQVDPSDKDTIVYPALDIRIDRLSDTLPIPSAVVETGTDWTFWDTVYMTGYPNGVHISVEGEIVGLDSDTDFLYLDIPGWFGSSGSGVYNNEGRLIGVFHSVLVGHWPGGNGFELLEGMRRFSILPAGFPSQ